MKTYLRSGSYTKCPFCNLAFVNVKERWARPELDKLLYGEDNESRGGGSWDENEIWGWNGVAPTAGAASTGWYPERDSNVLHFRLQIAVKINARRVFFYEDADVKTDLRTFSQDDYFNRDVFLNDRDTTDNR